MSISKLRTTSSSSLRIRTQIGMLTGFFMIAFVTIAVNAFFDLENVKVKGPLYKGIAMGKDLRADFLPPPCSILESYHVAYQGMGETTLEGISAWETRAGDAGKGVSVVTEAANSAAGDAEETQGIAHSLGASSQGLDRALKDFANTL